MLNFIAQWRREREAVRELSRLSDRELADLGVVRSDIPSIVAGASMARDEAAPASAPSSQGRGDAMAPSWGRHNRRSLAA